MSNSYNNTPADAELQAIIQEAQEGYVQGLLSICTIALLLYTAILSLAQEKEHVWSKRFSLPNLLYIFTRSMGALSVRHSASHYIFSNLCNNIADAGNAIFILTYVGVQGLLVARAYSLCHEHKVVVGALAFLFLGGLTLGLYGTIAFSGCLTLPLNTEANILNTFTNINTVLVDLLVFGICLWKVWDTWKLKRGTGIQSNNDLVSILIKQIISRFCQVLWSLFPPPLRSLICFRPMLLYNPIFRFFNRPILIAEFTLDLRQRNSAGTRATSVALPTIQMQSMLQYVHESIITGMGDQNHENKRAGGNDITGIRSADYDIESAQDEGVSA